MNSTKHQDFSFLALRYLVLMNKNYPLTLFLRKKGYILTFSATTLLEVGDNISCMVIIQINVPKSDSNIEILKVLKVV